MALKPYQLLNPGIQHCILSMLTKAGISGVECTHLTSTLAKSFGVTKQQVAACIGVIYRQGLIDIERVPPYSRAYIV